MVCVPCLQGNYYSCSSSNLHSVRFSCSISNKAQVGYHSSSWTYRSIWLLIRVFYSSHYHYYYFFFPKHFTSEDVGTELSMLTFFCLTPLGSKLSDLHHCHQAVLLSRCGCLEIPSSQWSEYFPFQTTHILL